MAEDDQAQTPLKRYKTVQNGIETELLLSDADADRLGLSRSSGTAVNKKRTTKSAG